MNNNDKKYITNEDMMPYIYKYRETGIVPEELGEILLMIAENFANRGSFHGYTWKQDMVAEAVFTCIRYIHNFDPIRYKEPNPFAYFTSIIKNSFLNYIKKQKKHSKIKDLCYTNCELVSKDFQRFNNKETKAIDYTIIRTNGTKDK